ncbi:MAG: restriction endonuclease, partial [Candidatus Portnoybacteria bacterium CG_4_8_14_3_um_filter_44_15]
MKNWDKKVKEYCEKYNIPIFYLAETLYEPKVVPMIRGKAFEFSVMMALQEILPKNK